MKVWLARARWVLTPLAILAVAYAGYEVVRRLSEGKLSVQLDWLALVALCVLLGYIALCWGFVRFLGHHVTPKPSALMMSELYFRSLLARYLPGKVGVPAMRIASAESLGAPPALLGASVFLEGFAWLSTGALVCALLLAVAGDSIPKLHIQSWALLAIPVALLGVFILSGVDVARYPAWVRSRLPVQTLQSGALVPWALVWGSALYWLVTAVGCGFAARALGGDMQSAVLAAFAGVTAPLVGFFALAVPAGIGVREYFLLLVLGASLGKDNALGLALITRAIGIVFEVLVWLVLVVGTMRERKRIPSPPGRGPG